MPGAVSAIQTFGDLLGFNPHCHVLCTDGCFDEKAIIVTFSRGFVKRNIRMLLYFESQAGLDPASRGFSL
jgi:hypothetical protein